MVITYSVSFVLVGYACWLVTAYGMKQHNAATLMLFVLLAIGGAFLHCISEPFQLMFYVPMLYAWMCKSDGVKLFTYYAVLASSWCWPSSSIPCLLHPLCRRLPSV